MMKLSRKDFAGAFFLLIPALMLMAPLIMDAYYALQPNNTEPIYIEVSAPEYGYNPSYINAEESHTVYIMRTVAYCPCKKCCGWNTGITYSGTMATQGRTVACNLNKFPIGTILLIDGHEYVVEDTGNLSENTIDIYFDSHDEALKYGSQWKVVEITEKEK